MNNLHNTPYPSMPMCPIDPKYVAYLERRILAEDRLHDHGIELDDIRNAYTLMHDRLVPTPPDAAYLEYLERSIIQNIRVAYEREHADDDVGFIVPA